MTHAIPSVTVWDLFVRTFHWSLVAAFAVGWATAESLPHLHQQAGYFIGLLLALRLVWGLIGSRYARFREFLAPPAQVLRYLRSLLTTRPLHYVGHNPVGGWMIVAILGTLAVTVATGWTLGSGEGWLEEIHEAGAQLTLALVVIHIGGVFLASLLHNENLVAAMLTGRKTTEK
jgi:cytochrome b